MWSVVHSSSRTRDISGGIRAWLTLLVTLVVVGAGLVSWVALHGSTSEARKPPVTSSATKTSSSTRYRSSNARRSAKLTVGLTVSSPLLYAGTNVSQRLLWAVYGVNNLSRAPASYANQFVRYDLTVKNVGAVSLRDTVVHIISAALPANYAAIWGTPGSNYGLQIIPGDSFLQMTPGQVSNGLMFNCNVNVIVAKSSCEIGSKNGVMAPGMIETIPLVASFNQVSASLTIPPSVSVAATVKGTAPDGKIVEVETPPVSVRVVPDDYNSTLSTSISLQPDPVALGQVFTMTVTLTNNSQTTPINHLNVRVPETPMGNPIPLPKGFPAYLCQGENFAYLTCEVNPSSSTLKLFDHPPSSAHPGWTTLPPGASESLEFPEIVPAPNNAYNIFTKQNPGQVEAAGSTPSGQLVYAMVTGYVNVS